MFEICSSSKNSKKEGFRQFLNCCRTHIVHEKVLFQSIKIH